MSWPLWLDADCCAVSGRARQLIHKMKNRRNAILSRREQEAENVKRNAARSDGSPMSVLDANGMGNPQPARSIEVSQSPPVGFTAVNLKQPGGGEGTHRLSLSAETARNAPGEMYASNVTIINGKSIKDASPSVRAELMKNFLTLGEREGALPEDTNRRSSVGTPRANAVPEASTEKARSGSMDMVGASKQTQSTVAIPGTPASLMPHSKPSPMDRDDGGPFKAEMVRRMDNMWKGDRVIPPCDRCRRLHMDCLKNLTACMGCTKKHAKCSWKEVRADELHMSTQSADSTVEGGSALAASEIQPPLSAGSTIEVNRQSEDVVRSASIARASLDLTEGHPDTPSKEGIELKSRNEPAPGHNTSGRLDLRPPPLVQQLQDAAKGRSESSAFGAVLSPRERELSKDDDDDEGDRLQALASRVYRTASQSGHRS